MALYDDIWKQLKLNGKCKIAARNDLHRRIIHAVINKKYYDNGFKLLLLEEKRTAKLQYKRSVNCIEFTLQYYTNLNSIDTGDI